jgi:two-component system, OmpR family, response regulator
MIERVLLIDDDASIRRVGEICLTRVGNWEVALADSAKKALEILDTFKPDVILLDVMMPEVDGLSALPLIKQKTNNKVPIIFVTAKVMRHEVTRYLELGATGVVSKPFDPLTLPSDIQAIVQGALRPSVLTAKC